MKYTNKLHNTNEVLCTRISFRCGEGEIAPVHAMKIQWEVELYYYYYYSMALQSL